MHKKLLSKATSKLESLSLEAQSKLAAKVPSSSSSSSAAPPAPPLSEVPTERQIYQHRQQRGVNLGSLFALETWLVPSLFAGVKNAGSEMDLLQQLPAHEAKQRLEHHWGSFVNEGDWKWMVEHGVNTVRLPIGYVHFCAAKAPESLKGTEYEKYAEIYVGAWERVEEIIRAAKQHGVGVLMDLHCAPGAQNADGHSGLSGGKVGFWDGSRAAWNQQRTVDILASLASAISGYDNVVGLELLNEPRNDNRLQAFYERSIASIRARGAREAELPIYISDGWDAQWYTAWAAKRGDFIVVDTHVYRCFTPSDHKLSARDHAATMCAGGSYATQLAQLDGKAAKGSSNEGGSLIVGEWSAALHHTSLPRDGAQHNAARTEWANRQLEAFAQHAAGAFFWTLKKEGPPDPAWGLYSAIEQSVLPASLGAPKNAALPGKDQLDAARDEAFETHRSYWAKRGGRTDESWRFPAGFEQGWNDAAAFASMRVSSIGFKAQWSSTRFRAHLRQKGGDEKHAWEFEVGCAQGIKAFEEARGK